MLSYSWGNTYEDILDGLTSYCEKTMNDTKRTYVWICCLCNNQHRIVENRRKGIDVTFEDFKETFGSKVHTIKRVICLMSPWFEPIYLTRVWCIFELFTSHSSEDCTLYIEMPQGTKNDFIDFVSTERDGNKVKSTIEQVLGSTAIETAEASVPSDKEMILQLVQEDCGFNSLNKAVNELIRRWINDVLKDILDEVKKEIAQASDGLSGGTEKIERNIRCLRNLFNLFQIFFGNSDTAMGCAKTLLAYCLKHCGENDTNTSLAFNDLMNVYSDKGQYEKASEYGLKTVTIAEKEYGKNHFQTAVTYYNLGRVYADKNELDNALKFYSKAIDICKIQLGNTHEHTALIYQNIGSVYASKNENDQAMIYLKEAMSIYEDIANDENNGVKSSSLARTYGWIGSIYGKTGDRNTALEYYLQELEIREKIHGTNHHDTKQSYHKIMITYERLEEYDKVAQYRQKIRQFET